ncbi:MAG: glutamate synthase central domain-containing protein, partial [Acidimicrobiia bacterium]
MTALLANSHSPPRQGLYDPAQEHDSCGVNFVVDLQGRASHAIVETGIGALCNLQHRGALGAEYNTGDGAGILLQVPDRFFREVVDFDLPPMGEYATGMAFLPQDPVEAAKAVDQIEKLASDESLDVLGWRDVPVDSSMLGAGAVRTMPTFRQLFIAAHGERGIDLDRRAYVLRKRIEHEIHVEAGEDEVNEAMGGQSAAHDGVYFPSLSARTFIYKGMLTTPQLAEFYPDLADERVESALALVHSRFSTNTFPSWPLAHPFRFVAHNGEINTAQGNQNWMRAREALLESEHLGENASSLFPICTPGASDTARFDEALELLNLGGYSLQEAVLMMIPEPWENHESMPEDLKAFYRYHASLMEPWDGPASIAFTDGTVVGAVLDRNGLRPSRYWVTDDDLVIMASEVGVVDVPAHKIVEKGRLQPGRMFFVDTAEGRIVRDPEIKATLAAGRPYQEWLDSTQLELDDLPDRPVTRMGIRSLKQRQVTFGYTHEQLKLLIAPMVKDGKEAIGSMGTDTPIAVLSDRSRLLYDYFQQLFAQVTNPPLDAMREEIITATCGWLGPEGNLLDPQADSCRQIFIEHPVITNAELAKLIEVDQPAPDGSTIDTFSTAVVQCHFHSDEGGAGLRAAIEGVRARVSEAIADGKNLIVLSDRGTTEDLAPIPMLLAVGAVHHHLVREKSRTRVGLIVETGEAREVHHMCLLLGYGATAINPYLVFETIDSLIDDELYGLDAGLEKAVAHRNYIKACDKGVLKVMSKMGI